MLRNLQANNKPVKEQGFIMSSRCVALRTDVFYREESMNEYFAETDSDASEENLTLITGTTRPPRRHIQEGWNG